MSAPCTLVIFDLDGVIADTEPLHKESKQAILRELGLSGDVDMSRFVGRPNSLFWSTVVEENQLPCSLESLEERQNEGILRLLRRYRTPVTRDLPVVLEMLAKKGIERGVCSSSNRSYVDGVLSFYGIGGLFDPVVGGDEVAARKPAPDCYLETLSRGGVEPGQAVAIEDSAAGIAAANAAGIRTIGYRNPTSGNQDLSAAWRQVDGLMEILALLQLDA